jgi:hypothetical protein
MSKLNTGTSQTENGWWQQWSWMPPILRFREQRCYVTDRLTSFFTLFPLNLCTQPSVTVRRCASEQTSSGRCDVSRAEKKQLHYHVTVSRRPSPIPKPTRRGWKFTKVDTWTRVHAWRHPNVSVCSNSAFVTVLTNAAYRVFIATNTKAHYDRIHSQHYLPRYVLLDCYHVTP